MSPVGEDQRSKDVSVSFSKEIPLEAAISSFCV